MGIFVEREDKPKYLLVGKLDSPAGMTPYVNYDHLKDVLKARLDNPFYRDVVDFVMQEIFDLIFGEKTFDLKKNLTG